MRHRDTVYTAPPAPGMSLALLRAEFAAGPEVRQVETIRRVRRTLMRQARAGVTSYLSQHARDIYGAALGWEL